MVGQNNQWNTEFTNSEILNTLFIVQDKKRQQLRMVKYCGIQCWCRRINCGTKSHSVKKMIRILWHSGLSKKFYYHKDNIKIINIIQKGSHYQIDTIKEKSRKSDLDLMIPRGNYKSSHSYLNSASLEKSIRKEIDHGWELTLTIKSLQNI